LTIQVPANYLGFPVAPVMDKSGFYEKPALDTENPLVAWILGKKFVKNISNRLNVQFSYRFV
jgi:hypothetical protein